MSLEIGIIGSGFGLYGLLPAFHSIPECKVVSICGRKSERLLDFCKLYKIKNIYNDWKLLIQNETINAVGIATIPNYQYEIASTCLKKGIPVFAEKPLTIDLVSAEKLNQLTINKKLANMIDFNFPEIPEWKKARELMDKLHVGKILNVIVNWTFLSYDLRNEIKSWKTDTSVGGGAMSLYFSHVFYYLEYFLGKIIDLSCFYNTSIKSVNGGETVVTVLVKFENGCTGSANLNISSHAPPKHQLEFHGEEGTIILSNTSKSFTNGFKLFSSFNTDVSEEIVVQDTIPKHEIDGRISVVKPIAERFVDWCLNDIPSRPNFEDGLRVQELITQARDSIH